MRCVEVSFPSIITTERIFLELERREYWETASLAIFDERSVSPAGFVPLVGFPVAIISSVVGLVCASSNIMHTSWGSQPMRA